MLAKMGLQLFVILAENVSQGKIDVKEKSLLLFKYGGALQVL